ncbi:transcription antitermination factor NusB [Nonlabens sp. Ci31]|jgi:N utilization substance protein B|uniref:transcription antitermination factor NusB n=1 Tax=Nonlabens sp. Ci31 TaxID=2608253 RepID=UPI00146471E9|nr:transcription antitermination factor NusB [Nonlabens sp. Ci31]QJP33161.1 transcription antitermination factor NusB [Nonlabens sp. Ci31]
MLTRRQLRIKVMQAVFSFQRQRPEDLKDLEKFINSSMTQSYTLFLYMAQLLVKIHEVAVDKHTKKQQRVSKSVEHNPSRQLIDNKILLKLRESEALKEALKQRNLNPWHLDSKYVENLYHKIQESKTFVVYAMDDEPSVKKDLKFLTYIYEDIIAPSDELMDYLEDINITWTDDYPLINSTIIQFLRKVKPTKDVVLPALFKDESDAKFTMSLFRKTILNIDDLSARIEGKTPNWDTERIAQIDLVLIMMAQAEFLYFSDIPVKVTLNEYLEIAKDYSTPKSATFINGILDNLLKEFEKSDELNKMGRGLM